MPAAPLVSVVVRSMDRPELAEALRSLTAQQHPAIEVLVVDATGGRHRALPDLDVRPGHSMRIVGSGHPLPRADAADLGWMSASGEWVAFLDDDDTCEPDHLSGLVHAARASPDAVLVYGRTRILDEHGRLDRVQGRPFNRALMHAQPLLHWQASLVRTHVRDRGCRFDRSFEVCEDRDFVAQVAEYGDFAFASHLSTFNYRPDLGTSGTGTGKNRHHARFARFEQLLRAKWSGTFAWHAERALVKCRRGARALNAGDLRAARDAFAETLAHYPGDPNALHGMARIALAEGHRAEAERLVREAIDVNPRVNAFYATLAATGARVEPTSTDAPAGPSSASALREADDVAAWCEQAQHSLVAGDPVAAFEKMERASAVRCDAAVARLLLACCAALAQPHADASLRARLRSVCEMRDAASTPARNVLMIGEDAAVPGAAAALRRSGIVAADAEWRKAPSVESALHAIDASTCVVFCRPDDVPLHGVDATSPGRALLCANASGVEQAVRALARIEEGWPQARLDHLWTSL